MGVAFASVAIASVILYRGATAIFTVCLRKAVADRKACGFAALVVVVRHGMDHLHRAAKHDGCPEDRYFDYPFHLTAKILNTFQIGKRRNIGLLGLVVGIVITGAACFGDFFISLAAKQLYQRC